MVNKTEKRKIGDLGEGVACNYLKDQGFEILERNYWKPWGEIDIVARKQGIIHFIEVKTLRAQINADNTQINADENISRETGVPGKKGVIRETFANLFKKNNKKGYFFTGEIERSEEEKQRGLEKIRKIKENNGFVARETYNPAENIHPQKLKRLSKVIQTYILSHNIENKWEFSAIVVKLDISQKTAKVEHLKNLVL